MNEEDAFWLLIYIVEHLMPPEYYSRDKQLIGAQVDQVGHQRMNSQILTSPSKYPLREIRSCPTLTYMAASS